MRIALLLALGLVSTGCSRCESPPAASPDAIVKAPADAAPAVKPDAAPPPPADGAAVFPAEPGLPAALTGLSFDLDKATATEKFPAAVSEAGLVLGGQPGVVARVHFYQGEDRVRFAAVDLDEGLQSWLRATWKDGIDVKRPGGQDTYWLDPVNLRQFVLAGTTLGIWPMMPWERLLGDTRSLGFEVDERPLMGATVAEIEASYPLARPRKIGDRRVDLRFPPLPLQTAPTPVRLALRDGKVSSVRFKLFHNDLAPVRAAMLARLAQKYGTPETDAAGHRIYDVDLGAAGKTPARVKVLDLEVGGFLNVEIAPR